MKNLAGLAAVAMLVFAGIAYGYDGGGGAQTAAPASLHFLLREAAVPLDEGKPGPSDNERVSYRGPLLDPKTRKAVGTESGFCIVVDAAHEVRSVCQLTLTPAATSGLSFADQIVTQAIFDNVQSSKPLRSAITGGTGRYAGAGGELVSKGGPDGLIDVVLRFR